MSASLKNKICKTTMCSIFHHCNRGWKLNLSKSAPVNVYVSFLVAIRSKTQGASRLKSVTRKPFQRNLANFFSSLNGKTRNSFFLYPIQCLVLTAGTRNFFRASVICEYGDSASHSACWNMTVDKFYESINSGQKIKLFFVMSS